MRSRCDLDAILEAGKTAPPKQRHTAKRIFERLRIEHGFAGGYTVAKDCVRRATPQAARGFHPARPSAGPRERIDSGECAGIAGVRGKPHVFCFGLPRPDACFVKAYPAETGADKFTQSAQA